MWATVRAWAGSARAGRCKWCRRPVVWVRTDAGKAMPFDLGFTVREIVTDPRTRARFTVLDRDDRHDCAARRGQGANNRSHARSARR
jgi:hypothetical protein